MADADNGHTILVVEDDTDVRESIREVLEDAGYHVATAANGRPSQARRIAASNRSTRCRTFGG